MPLYISKNSQKLGPFEESVVFEMLRNGEILPEDFAMFEGQEQWSQLKILFPHLIQGWNSSNSRYTPPEFIQPKRTTETPVSAKSSYQRQLKLGIASLLILTLITFFMIGYSILSGTLGSFKKLDNKPQTHNLSWTKFDSMRMIAEELAQLSPQLKLEENPKIKGKVAVVIKERDRAAQIKGFDQYFNGYSLSNYETYGLAKRRLASKPEEIETLIQILCDKGVEITTSENGVKGYENLCKVSIIDYKNNAVVAQETFRNDRLPREIADIYKDIGEFVFLNPHDLISEYIAKFPLEKLNDPTTLVALNNDDGRYGKYHSFKNIASELARIDLPVKLNEKAVISGKIAIVQLNYNGEAELIGFDPYGKEFYQYELDRFGFAKNKMAENEDEIDTLIRINCRKGEILKMIEQTAIYSNKCEVSLVDYKQSIVIAQKTFEGKLIFGEVKTEIYPIQYVVNSPNREIENYVKSFSKS